jgi:hypothetical protein
MAGPTRSNPYTTGIAEQLRREKSERHRRAGMVGGVVTAKRHAGKHAEWAKRRGKLADGERET